MLELLSILGSSASIISLIKDHRAKGKEITPDVFSEIVDRAEEEGEKLSEDPQSIEATEVIDDDLLEIFRNNIKKSYDRFKKIWDDDRIGPADRDREQAILNSNVCEVLNRIRDFNQGELPPDLERFWLSHGCQYPIQEI